MSISPLGKGMPQWLCQACLAGAGLKSPLLWQLPIIEGPILALCQVPDGYHLILRTSKADWVLS